MPAGRNTALPESQWRRAGQLRRVGSAACSLVPDRDEARDEALRPHHVAVRVEPTVGGRGTSEALEANDVARRGHREAMPRSLYSTSRATISGKLIWPKTIDSAS